MNVFNAAAILVIKHRWLTVGLLLLISSVALYGYLFPPEVKGGGPLRRMPDPDWEYLQTVEEDFDLREIDAFLVFSGDDLLSRDAVTVLRQAARRVRELDYVEQIFWLDDIPIMNVFGLADPLLPPDDASEQSFVQARQRILEHPLVRGQLVATDGKTIVMPVFYQWINVESDQQITRDLLAEVRAVLQKYPDAHISVGLTGDVPLYVDQREFNLKNQRKFQIIGYTLAFVVAALLFRGVVPTIMVVSGAFTGMMWSFGSLRLMHQTDNPLTDAILPVLLAMVGIADSIHLATHIRASLRRGLSNREASMLAIREIGPACFLTSLTTAIGFGSLMLANSTFVQGFGKSCAVGVLLTFLSVISVLPLLASSWLGKSLIEGERRDWVETGLQRFRWFVDGLISRKVAVSIFAIVITLLLSSSLLRLKPDSNITSSLPSSAQSVLALQHADQTMGGIQFARIIVEWDDSVARDSPEILRVVKEVEALVNQQPLLSHPLSINSLLYSLPGDASDVDHRLPLLDLLPRQLRDAFINLDAGRTLVNVRLQSAGIAAYRPVFAELRTEFAQIAVLHPGFKVAISGETVVRSRRIYQIVTDLARSLGAASVIILVVMTLAYRSLRLGLISIIPNMFPLALTAFFLFLTGHPLDISTVCAFTVCLGIAVDDTIHFLGWFRRSMAAGNTAEVAVRDTFINVGKPLIFTTILMVSGFATILTSDLPDQRVFGAMACSTIGSALIGDMVFLPAFLAWLVPTKRQ